MIDLALVKRAVAISMHAPDDFALQIVYTGKDGVRTRRIVSPIRLLNEDRFEALCLCREEPRSFFFDQCDDWHYHGPQYGHRECHCIRIRSTTELGTSSNLIRECRVSAATQRRPLFALVSRDKVWRIAFSLGMDCQLGI